MQKIAIIGGGLSGLVCAHLLNDKYDVTLFEEKGYLGGHSYTYRFEENGKQIAIDLGFILFNQQGYPSFIELLSSLDVPLHKSDFSFSYTSRSGIEYKGPQLGTPFAPLKNLLNPKSYQLYLEIRRFNQLAVKHIESASKDLSLKQLVEKYQFDPMFLEAYLFPILYTLLSITKQKAGEVSSQFIFRYLVENGLTESRSKPTWYFLKAGSLAYIDLLCKKFKHKIKLKTSIDTIERDKYLITIRTKEGSQTFDKLILATRADQALSVLQNPSPLEQRVLGSMVYTKNNIFLHTDKSLMPADHNLWAGLNYRGDSSPVLTYHANKVQNFKSKKDYFITMSQGSPVTSHKIIKQTELYRPIVTLKAQTNQLRLEEINGILNTYYCGSYWGTGTHEDAVKYASMTANQLLNILEHS